MSELYELPDGWKWKTLNDIFLIERGGSPRPIKDFITDDEDGINWIKIGDTKEGEKYIYKTKEKIKKEGLKKSRLVIEGDFILSNSMSFGRPYIVKTKGAIHDGWLLMRDKLENISKDYFYYLLGSNYMYQQFSFKASGSTVKNLNIDLVKSTNVPLPPLPEQQRIVTKLDKLFEKIDKAITLHQKNMDETDAFMGSVLNDVFGELEEKYGVEKLKALIVMNYGKALKQADRIHGDIEVFGSNGVVGYHNESLIDYPTIIIGRKGSVGETNLSLGRSWTIDTAYYIDIIDNSRLDLFFIFYYTKIMDISDITQKGVKPGVNRNDYLDKFIPLPPLLIQQKVVKYLDEISEKIEKVKLVQNEKMESLKALKASILDKAFRGKL